MYGLRASGLFCMSVNSKNGPISFPRGWRDLVNTYLNRVLALASFDYAAFVDMSMGRERYVFATRENPLPDINWHALIGILIRNQTSKPEYALINSDSTGNGNPYEELNSFMDPESFDAVLCVPVGSSEKLNACVCFFGSQAGITKDVLQGQARDEIDSLTDLLRISIRTLVENNGSSQVDIKPVSLFKRLPEGLLLTDKDGLVIEINDTFTNLTGIPADRLIGQNLRENPILGTDCDYLVARLLETRQAFEIVSKIGSDSACIQDNEDLVADPEPGKFLRIRGTTVPCDSGEDAGLLLLVDDVTGDVIAKQEASQRSQRHSHEIELASRLQQSFFPQNYQKKRIRILTRLIAAHELAGDFFDIFDLGPNTIGLLIGDVVGKGIPSSLMAMSVHGMIANQAGALTPPMKILERVNEGLYNQVKGDYWYATCFFAKIHVTQLKMTYSRAGHELPLWIHSDSGETTWLEGEGMPLGIFPDSRYVTQQIQLKEGDRLLFYTDGLTDTINPAGERFGHERLAELFSKHSGLSLMNLLKVLEKEILEFHATENILDDIALALLAVVPDSWTTLTIPPYTFSEVLEGLLDEMKFKGIGDDVLFKVRLSIDECVVNAYRHGHQEDERKPITIGYLIESDRLTIKIRDQGPGFDFGLIPDPTLMENLLQPGGRGVFLTLKMMDEVSFNDVGNEVTMVKYLHEKE